MTKRQFEKRKAMHILLYDQRVTDYEAVRAYHGIENDNDLVRYLFAAEAHRIQIGAQALAGDKAREAHE